MFRCTPPSTLCLLNYHSDDNGISVTANPVYQTSIISVLNGFDDYHVFCRNTPFLDK